MKSHPILFSTPMVQAILKGTKTQTRRIITPHRSGPCGSALKKDLDWSEIFPNNQCGIKVGYRKDDPFMAETVHRVYPLYDIGDQLWVRETWQHTECLSVHPSDEELYGYVYRADGEPWEDYEGWRWKPSIFMPREASRITLEVTDIRVERLHDISAVDAISEGIKWEPGDEWTYYDHLDFNDPYRSKFYELWQSINGPESWDINPWVWVIQFRRIKPQQST